MKRTSSRRQANDAARQWAALVDEEFGEDVFVSSIAPGVTFLQWCELEALDRINPATGRVVKGLRIDGKPFDLKSRPALRAIYEALPSTREEAFRMQITLRKCAQVGFSVLEMLYAIFIALKFGPLGVGMFMPDQLSARGKSARFIGIIRTIPTAYELLVAPKAGAASKRRSEGNVMTRDLGESVLHFLWTSGMTTTESHPMGFVSFDEVQEMLIPDMEKVGERMSASDLKLTLMGSTANWPDADIDYWYKKGSQNRFHTLCPTCGRAEPLDEYFPACIKFDETFPDRVTGVPGDYRYVCRDGHWIDDPQQGEWIADNPEAELRKNISYHFHQMLSPTISPREMYEAYVNADDMKNFFNRKLGKPYQDPSQIPVTLAHLNACVEAGRDAPMPDGSVGVVWKKRARDTFMGVDQMGQFNVVIIKERLPDGRQMVIHAEAIYDPNPFLRCSELMDEYGVRACVVEQLPNFNDAMRFANRHVGQVFLCNGYGELEEDVVRWGDAPKLDVSDRRTEEDERTRYTVRIDQYKAMSMSLARLVKTQCLFPDPQELVQEIRQKNALSLKPILKDVVFLHFQKTALVTERINEGERKLRRRVVKVGIDPHFAYANMLCDVAWARAHGTATFILSGAPSSAEAPSVKLAAAPGLPDNVVALMEPLPPGEICGRCVHYPIGPDGPPAEAPCKISRGR